MTAVSQPGDNTVIFESVRRHSALSRRLEGATDSEARSQGNRMLYNVLYQEERANQNAHVPSSRNTERHFRVTPKIVRIVTENIPLEMICP